MYFVLQIYSHYLNINKFQFTFFEFIFISMDKLLILRSIKTYLGFKTDKDFADFLEIKTTTLAMWYKREVFDIELIFKKCEQLNPEWLLTGKEPMLKANRSVVNESRNLIPFYEDVQSIGGSNLVAETGAVYNSNILIDAGDWFKGATAAIRHYNDSMVEYPSGCILALRELKDKTEIEWGRNYVVETREMRVTKKISEFDQNFIMGYSTNKETYFDGTLIHQPIKIRKESILKIARVLGSVNKEESTGMVQLI